MKKIIKITLGTLLVLVVLFTGALGLFMYKITNGFPVSYETEAPQLEIADGKRAILLFSKATGFVHEESIEAGKVRIAALADKNGWFLYETEEGGVFNPEQLNKFDVVIFNNSTGRVLDDEQQAALESYVETGGKLLGIHGAGDNSHHWDWYTESLLGTTFSHHSLNPQFQEAEVLVHQVPDSALVEALPKSWVHSEEWYVFLSNPREKGFQILMSIDGESINPDGNILFVTDKDFGMGKAHPVAWYKEVGLGRTYYTSLGHSGAIWDDPVFVGLIENILGAGR